MLRRVLTVCLCVLPIAAFGMDQYSDSDMPSQQKDSSSLQSDGMLNGMQSNGQAMAGQTVQLEPLIGKTVMDAQQNEIGKVQDVVVDSQSQQAKFAVLGVGGFLGVGEDYHAVPWSALQIQSVGDTIQSVRVSANSDVIKNSPKIEMGTTRSFNSSLQSRIDSYYQGKGIQTNGIQTDGMQQDGAIEQFPSNGDMGTRPSGMTGTSTQDRQFNTAQPQTDNIYGDGVRSGEPGDLTNMTNGTNGVSPFGSDGTTGTNGAYGTDAQQSGTATQYRKGYAEGASRVTQPGAQSDTESLNGASNGQHVQAADSQFIYFSDLAGRPVRGAQDEQLGSIKDLVVDSRQGKVLFGLVSLDDGMVAIPWSSLQRSGKDAYVVNIEKDTLRTLAFRSDSKPDFSDPSYQQRVYSQFGQQPPTVYGYVSPEAGGMMDQTEKETMQKFDPQRIETINGEVKEIRKDMKQTGQSQMQTQQQQKSMCLTVETEQGQSMKVYAAPEQFLKDRGLDLSQGDTIRVTGSRTQIQGEDALIATKISKDTKEVMLRSSQGQPMWQTGTSGSQPTQPGQQTGNGMTDGQTNGQDLTGQSLQFNADEQTTLSGTVQSTDSGTLGATMDQAVLFKVQTDQGQTTTVYAGPRDYLQEQNMTFNSGDTIQATGWKKTIAGQEVFIASSIQKDGQTLQLRDSSGMPKWKEKSGLFNGTDAYQKSKEQKSNGILNGSTTTY